MPESRFWKLYREERVKLVRAAHPEVKRPFQVVLRAPEIIRCAREARRRLDA